MKTRRNRETARMKATADLGLRPDRYLDQVRNLRV
jgi:hypothetical protein